MAQRKKHRQDSTLGRFNDLAGEVLETLTFGLYQATNGNERRGMDIQPIHNNTQPMPVPGGQFGVGRLRDKLQRKLRRTEEEAFTQQLEYAKVNYLLKAALQQVSDARLSALVREAGDVELMNKLVSPSEFTTPEQHEEFLAQIAAYQQETGQLMDLAGEMILRKFIEHTAGLPSNSFID